VREAWRERSAVGAWLRPDDWYTPEVEAVAEFAADDADPRAALEALGRARGAAGVGLAETLADVKALFEALDALTASDWAPPARQAVAIASPQAGRAATTDQAVRPVRARHHGRGVDVWEAVIAVGAGWAEGAACRSGPTAVVDPVTDLPTFAYLEIRLREIYERAAADGAAPPSQTHALLIAETAVEGADPWQRFQRGALLGHALRRVFDGGETVVSLGSRSGAAVVLVERQAGLPLALEAAHCELETLMRGLQRDGAARHPVRIWVEPLPPEFEAAREALRDIAGHD
jgi:hypothetical protein